MADDIADMAISNVVEFQSKSSIDENKYYGTVLGFFNYEIAKQYMDIDAYHNNVLLNYSSLGEKEVLNYFLIREQNQELTICFAKEWILESSFEIIESLNKIIIEINDIDLASDPNAILGILRGHGYKSVRVLE